MLRPRAGTRHSKKAGGPTRKAGNLNRSACCLAAFDVRRGESISSYIGARRGCHRCRGRRKGLQAPSPIWPRRLGHFGLENVIPTNLPVAENTCCKNKSSISGFRLGRHKKGLKRPKRVAQGENKGWRGGCRRPKVPDDETHESFERAPIGFAICRAFIPGLETDYGKQMKLKARPWTNDFRRSSLGDPAKNQRAAIKIGGCAAPQIKSDEDFVCPSRGR